MIECLFQQGSADMKSKYIIHILVSNLVLSYICGRDQSIIWLKELNQTIPQLEYPTSIIPLTIANKKDNYTNTTKDIHTTNWEYYFDPSIIVYLLSKMFLSSIRKYSLHFIITYQSNDRLKAVISSDGNSKIVSNNSRSSVIVHYDSMHITPILVKID